MSDSAASLVERWYREEAARVRSPRGVPNAGLHVLERFRAGWPLRDHDYLTAGGGQVAGLSGASGDVIIQRFAPHFMSIGTEAGRTSRSTPGAARRLAEALNELPREIGTNAAARSTLADQMQRWIVEEVLAPELAPHAPVLELRPDEPFESALDRYLEDPVPGSTWVRSTETLLMAVIEIAIQCSVAARARHGRPILRIGDTSMVLSELPTVADVEVCSGETAAGRRCIVLTRADRVLASAQLLEAAGLQDVAVDSAARFTARLIDVASAFEPGRRDDFIATLNARAL